MIALLIDTAAIMDQLYWQQTFGENKADFLEKIKDPKVRKFADINYGPWDRLDGDKPFLTGYEEKPLGAEFYPHDITKKTFEAQSFDDSKGLYSVVERDSSGKLKTISYAVKYKGSLVKTADLLRQVSKLAKDPQFANYLNLRADVLLSNEYQASDMSWMNMKNNPIDVRYRPDRNLLRHALRLSCGL
jgi:hypothetical protein